VAIHDESPCDPSQGDIRGQKRSGETLLHTALLGHSPRFTVMQFAEPVVRRKLLIVFDDRYIRNNSLDKSIEGRQNSDNQSLPDYETTH